MEKRGDAGKDGEGRAKREFWRLRESGGGELKTSHNSLPRDIYAYTHPYTHNSRGLVLETGIDSDSELDFLVGPHLPLCWSSFVFCWFILPPMAFLVFHTARFSLDAGWLLFAGSVRIVGLFFMKRVARRVNGGVKLLSV